MERPLLSRCHGQMLTARKYSVQSFLVNAHQTAQKMCWTLLSRSHHCGRSSRVKYYDLFALHTGNAKLQYFGASSEVIFLGRGTDKTQLTKSRLYWKLRVMRVITAVRVRLTDKTPLHDIKVGVWCVVRAARIIGQIFFSDKICWQNSVNVFLKIKIMSRRNMHSSSKTEQTSILPTVQCPNYTFLGTE